jgi:hypothetical protein
MDELAQAAPRIPTAYGVLVFMVLFGLLVHKEARRVWGISNTRHAAAPEAAPTWRAVLARRWQQAENPMIALLLGVYGFILLARLLSFFA